MKRTFVISLLSVLSVLALAQSGNAPRVSILGDSYSTFEGWLNPGWNAVWYFNRTNPNNDVSKVEQTWWHILASEMGYKLERNNSFSGSTICYTGYNDSEGNHQDYSDRSFIGRAGDLGHPDLILVCGGTNDSWCGAPVGDYKWDGWTNEDLYFFRPAMAKMCSELLTLYPEARVVFILNSELRDEINDSVHRICRHYGIECVDLHDIDKQYGHPSIAGMRAFATQVEAQLGKECHASGSDAKLVMTKAELQDKIKGGWAGQAIGCTYGGPTEFRYSGTMINDNIGIEWPEHYLKSYFDNSPGLYDDIYMDLTFVDVFDKEGLDAPIEHFAEAFANAKYPLWHANQQARYNILQGMTPPECGYWENNPHADDIDFQIEADYAGLMAPCMPNAASHYSDAIGHIMNYGDGWYGGVYVAAMYSLAFMYDDIEAVVKEALKTIPAESKFYRCMSDVIRWHDMYPGDWELTWALAQKHWSFDIGCPDGVYQAFNIDAVINSAYIIIGLLYGEGDFARTIEIATRCGQDSDCNPASAGGILGTMLGYSNIPEFWMPNLREVEDRNFAYTDISLNKVYRMSYDQALQVIEENGGSIGEDVVTIVSQAPGAVRFEESFSGHWPVAVNRVNKPIDEVGELSFEGKGIVVSFRFDSEKYGVVSDETDGPVSKVKVFLDGELSEKVILPSSFHSRKQELYYKYNLPAGPHTLSFKWLNPGKDDLIVTSYIVYSDKPGE